MGRDREILKIVARYCGKTSSIYRYIAQDIAALTREAAPQASGGDGVGRWFVCVSCLAAVNLPVDVPRPARCQCSPSSFMLWPIKLPKGFAIRRLATTDSAIQSQQGATGGAVDCPYCTTGNCKTCEDAHPQAAGSAPVGDAKDAVAWLIAGTERNGVRFRTVHLHNAIADYRDIDPDATVTPLYAGDAKP